MSYGSKKERARVARRAARRRQIRAMLRQNKQRAKDAGVCIGLFGVPARLASDGQAS